jgi:hypothetical protein
MDNGWLPIAKKPPCNTAFQKPIKIAIHNATANNEVPIIGQYLEANRLLLSLLLSMMVSSSKMKGQINEG